MTSRGPWNLRVFVYVLLPLAAACGSSTPARTITGQLQAGAYRVNNPVVIAQGADHRVFVTHVTGSGSFQLSVPTGVSYRLLLANTTHSGYRAISRILWPSKSQWANVGPGPVLNFKSIHPRGSATASTPPMGGNSQGEDRDDQDEEDDAVVCKASDETDSEDDNDQGEQEGMTSDDNENEHEMDAENESSSKCGCVATHQESDDDDEMEGVRPAGTATADAGCPAPTPGTPPPGPGSPPPAPPAGPGGPGAACHVNGDCASGLICVTSVCQAPGPLI
jgi:hypothetical protein